MIDNLKQLAGQASESYLLRNKSMNDTIYEMANREKLNDEMVKRVCEYANANTYLTIFNTDREKRGNITFELADSSKIISKLKELHMAEDDYLKTPERFSPVDEEEEDEELTPTEEEKAEPTIDQKIQDLNRRLQINDRLSRLLSSIKTMAGQEIGSAENSIFKISSYCRDLTWNGESFADMAKLGMRFSQDKGYDIQKTAKLYDEIYSDLKNRGFKVNNELTKISSMDLNKTAEVFKPLEEYHESIRKIAGFVDMQKNIENVLDFCRSSVKKG
jgi:hypothetical protein